MRKHLVLVGAGHAHMTTLLSVEEFISSGHRVTVISPSRYHYYSGMGPGMLSGIYRPQEIRFNVGRMATDRGAQFIEQSVVRVDGWCRVLHLSGGGEVSYDIASFNTGSNVLPIDAEAPTASRVVRAKPIINLYKARRVVLDSIAEGVRQDLVVAGGGPAGVEIASNLWRLLKDAKGEGSITLVAGERLLSGTPVAVRDRVLASFERRGIGLVEGLRVSSVEDGEARLSDGSSLPCRLALLATGVRPSSLFKDSKLPTGPDGGLLVDRYLRNKGFPQLFGGGDCISLFDPPLARVGVYAVRQNPTLLHNLKAALDGGELKPFDTTGDYMLIMNMGDRRGVLWRKGKVWSGRLAFLLKDLIDRRFMRRFQVSGEMSEPLGDIDE